MKVHTLYLRAPFPPQTIFYPSGRLVYLAYWNPHQKGQLLNHVTSSSCSCNALSVKSDEFKNSYPLLCNICLSNPDYVAACLLHSNNKFDRDNNNNYGHSSHITLTLVESETKNYIP